MTSSTDLDTDHSLGPQSVVDDSLDARKQKLVAAVDQTGVAAAFEMVLSEGHGVGMQWVVAETQGRRPTMEDAHVVQLNIDGKGTSLFAVFDGHAGGEVAAFCAQHVVEELLVSKAFRAGDVQNGLREAFFALEERMKQEDSRDELAAYTGSNRKSSKPHKYGMRDEQGNYIGPDAGATAAVAVLQGDKLHVAHAGDTRVVLASNGVALALTKDHKPNDPQEQKRIEEAGSFVMQRPGMVPRVAGTLALSRALGDTKYKDQSLPVERQAVTAAPHLISVTLSAAQSGRPGGAPGGPAPRLLLVACDGLWEAMTRQTAVDLLGRELASNGGDLRGAVSALFLEALRPDSNTPATTDNVTTIVVRLPDQ